MTRRREWILGAAYAAVLAGSVIFSFRTAFRGYTPCDFAVLYSATRAWMEGSNPYDEDEAMVTWLAADGRRDIMSETIWHDFGKRWIPILLIPQSLPLLIPLALSSAPVGTALWWSVCLGLFVAAWIALVWLMPARLNSPEALFLLAGCLMLAPVHECFAYGQPSLPSICLIILSVWSVSRQRDTTAGVLLALATALKPQLGGVFLIFYALRGHWRLFATFVLVMLGLSAVAMVPMMARGTPWLSTWLSNLSAAEATGAINSSGIENAARSHLLNLQVILRGLIPGQTATNLLALLITASLAAMFAWQWRRTKQKDELLPASIVGVLALLPMYHRFYDAALMMMPLAWGTSRLRSQPGLAVPVLLFVGMFVAPDRTVLHLAKLVGETPAMQSGVIWDAFIEPSRVWLLLLGYGLLIRCIVPCLKFDREVGCDPERDSIAT